VDLFLEVQESSGQHRFKNRHLVPAARALLGLLRERIVAHRSAGDLDRWLGEELPLTIEQKLGGPVVARAVDLLKVVEQDERSSRAINGLLSHLIDEIQDSPSFRASLTGIADLVQLLLDDIDLVPLLRALGEAIAPEHGLVRATLRFLKPALARDTDQCLSKILRNAYQEQSPGRSPVQTLLDLTTELHRVRPGAGTPYEARDFQEALRQTREFLSDQRTGLQKFFEIVKNR
jgi:hypothetical protein